LIRIVATHEPIDFEARVRSPGNAFLATIPNPIGRQWEGHEYWRNIHGDLFLAYKGICAYCASWTMLPDSSRRPIESSVDHFIPKSAQPTQAYEWNNFRLSRRRLNQRKGNHQDVIDPFLLAPRWFKINFSTFLINPHEELSVEDRLLVEKTIERLELNADNDYVQERISVIREYCLSNITIEQIQTKYPFIALEMEIQNFDEVYLPHMREYFRRLV
jgi:uncharacterized protein (TIGR02646 family)